MKYTEGRVGRVFMLRLEDGDKIPDCIETFAKDKDIKHGQVTMIGCLSSGDVVAGPRVTEEMPPDPIKLPIEGAHDTLATGVIAPDEAGNPILHLHGALGRAGKTLTGCIRAGAKTWLIGEVVIYELLDLNAVRKRDDESCFVLLDI